MSIVNSSLSHNMFPTSKIINGKLVFDNPEHFDLALKLGAFYLKIPSNLDLHPGIQLARNFYKNLNDNIPGYTGYRQRSYDKSALGYADRPDQVEQVQLEHSLWDEFFPKEVADLLRVMNILCLQILESVLEYAGVPKENWDMITNGAFVNNAGHNTTINHYRPEKEKVGIVSHKDSGYLTLLYVSSPGLEALLDGEWHSIDLKEGYFVVNLGHSLEILTENLKKPITAVIHRVRQLYSEEGEDRVSFTVFITPRYDGNMYQYDNQGSLGIYRDYLSFLKERFRKVKYASHGVSNDEVSASSNVIKLSSLYDE